MISSRVKQKKFIIKKKPVKPKRKESYVSFFDEGGDGDEIEFSKIEEWKKQNGLEKVFVSIDRAGFDDSWLSVYAVVEEPILEYQRRLEKYKRDLSEWKRWTDGHKEQIQAEKQRRKEEKLEKQKERQKEIEKFLEKIGGEILPNRKRI